MSWLGPVSPAANKPGRHGVWTTCDRCGYDNWCIGDPGGAQDDISGELTEYVCWDFCVASRDEEDALNPMTDDPTDDLATRVAGRGER